jgi:peptidoglycan hydrolase-like protein with peptidoglycan-binding domain
MKLYNPAPGRKITSTYGPRRHPITGEIGRMHRGIDYGGTFDVLAAQDGVVHLVSYNGNKKSGGGHVVIIKHGTRLFTVYYHGAHRTRFNKGDRINAGEVIYRSGSTGASTGPHLHFEVRTGINGQWGTDVDPNIYLTGSKPDVPTGSDPYKVSLRVDGKPSRDAWRGWQTALKARWGYRGMIDGIPGKMTWEAIQRSCGKSYTGRIDGIPGPLTRSAVQVHLKSMGYYSGPIDNILGRGSWSAIQRALNDGKY